MKKSLTALSFALVGLCLLASPLARSATATQAQIAPNIPNALHLLDDNFYAKLDWHAVTSQATLAVVAAAKQHKPAHFACVARADDLASATQCIQASILATARNTGADPIDLSYAALRGVAKGTHDRWAAFFSPKEFARFNQLFTPNSISGVGVLLQVIKGQPAAAYFVMPGSPADQAGLRSGDQIISVDGHPTLGLPLDGVSHLLRGASGSHVSVSTINADGAHATYDIVRSVVRPPTVIYQQLGSNIGYIAVDIFGSDTGAEFATDVNRLRQSGAKAFVIDLRYDGGGMVDAALQVSSQFVSNNPIVSVESRGSQVTTDYGDGFPAPSEPIVVLVNGYTASASEIVAAALQDNGVAKLVGTRTFGKGVMQDVYSLPDGSGFKFTYARYFTPNHHNINGTGIAPNVVVAENPHAVLGDPKHDKQLQSAMAMLAAQIASMQAASTQP
ncbi:MAG TPA: S41 family peptidase [Verrucomicrobiae bacterium]|jgi:carboxyl-terminal processing protease|nr:S41 family peptidase [Verrucomicrobiae bacterium]